MKSLRGCVVCDGADDVQGRALLLISSLHHAAPALAGTPIRFVNVTERSVAAAIELLRWDLGLDAREHPHDPDDDVAALLADARLYAAITFSDDAPAFAAAARKASVPTLIAVQFPAFTAQDRQSFVLLRSAHDPAVFARRLIGALGPAPAVMS